jgi:ElaB/YqjD/DUF883 family membrane-anchored ribosome-binding protein
MPIIPPRLLKIYWVIYVVVVFLLTTWVGDLVKTVTHPYTLQLLNATGNGVPALIATAWNWLNFIPIVLTLIIVGLTAAWRVKLEQDKTKKTEKELKEIRSNADAEIQKIFNDTSNRIERVKESVDKRAKESLDEANEKIEEIQNNAFERIHKAEQEIELNKADFYESLQVNKDFTDRMVSEAEIKAKYDCDKRVAQWVSDCQYLLDLNQRLEPIRKLSNMSGATGSAIYKMDMILEHETSEDTRIKEILDRLQKAKNN